MTPACPPLVPLPTCSKPAAPPPKPAAPHQPRPQPPARKAPAYQPPAYTPERHYPPADPVVAKAAWEPPKLNAGTLGDVPQASGGPATWQVSHPLLWLGWSARWGTCPRVPRGDPPPGGG